MKIVCYIKFATGTNPAVRISSLAHDFFKKFAGRKTTSRKVVLNIILARQSRRKVVL